MHWPCGFVKSVNSKLAWAWERRVGWRESWGYGEGAAVQLGCAATLFMSSVIGMGKPVGNR